MPKACRPQQSSSGGFWASKSTRETVESIVVAFILAFLFRTFEAEAFVIPTGSMAPTLMGKHKDVRCWQCGFPYRASASDENVDSRQRADVVQCSCPMCGYVMDCHRQSDRNRHGRKERTYNGDRILVSKFSYQIGDPKRWDVIVFKYPGNAKMNYIKRLVGLPNEAIHIQNGDVFVADNNGSNETSSFRIARKSPHKLTAMLQLVHDNQYCPQSLLSAGWPVRWQARSADASSENGWVEQLIPDSRLATRSRQKWNYRGNNNDSTAWIRYGAYAPDEPDSSLWHSIEEETSPVNIDTKTVQPRYVIDHYAYNEASNHYEYNTAQARFGRRSSPPRPMNWVGDLAVEAEIEIENEAGIVQIELTEGGHVFHCKFDIATGITSLTIDGGAGNFLDDNDEPKGTERSAKTRVQGSGKYRLKFANCDDQLVLWINGKVVGFDAPTTYAPLDNDQTTPTDHWPAAVGSQGAQFSVDALRIYRDVFFIATDFDKGMARGIRNESGGVTFKMEENQYFVLGDNSPASKDGRLWRDKSTDPHWVDRDLLIGKALFIYWPHSRADIFPFCPNLPRMGFVR